MTVWQGRPTANFNTQVYGRIYDGNGDPVAPAFAVSNEPSGSSSFQPRVTTSPDGAWIVTWRTFDARIVAQRLDAVGNAVGNEVVVTDTLIGQSSNVAAGANGFVVGWWKNREDPEGIYGQR